MTNEKGFGMTEEELLEKDTTPRARNRTVMLSPEMTGAVRAKIAQGLISTQGGVEPVVARDSLGISGNRSSDATSGPQPVGQDERGIQPLGYEQPRVAAVPPPGPFPAAHPSFPGPVPQGAGRAPQGSYVRYTKLTPIVGFLVSFDSNPDGDFFELRSGRLIITSDESSPGSIIHISDSTVSPSHAILRMTPSGDIQVLDQLSEFGTEVRKGATAEVIQLSGDKCSLNHGDVLKVGERSFHVCLVARSDGGEAV
jgi:hypothetical protein